MEKDFGAGPGSWGVKVVAMVMPQVIEMKIVVAKEAMMTDMSVHAVSQPVTMKHVTVLKYREKRKEIIP